MYGLASVTDNWMLHCSWMLNAYLILHNKDHSHSQSTWEKNCIVIRITQTYITAFLLSYGGGCFIVQSWTLGGIQKSAYVWYISYIHCRLRNYCVHVESRHVIFPCNKNMTNKQVAVVWYHEFEEPRGMNWNCYTCGCTSKMSPQTRHKYLNHGQVGQSSFLLPG